MSLRGLGNKCFLGSTIPSLPRLTPHSAAAGAGLCMGKRVERTRREQSVEWSGRKKNWKK